MTQRIARILIFVLTFLAYGAGALPAADAVSYPAPQIFDYPESDKAALVECLDQHRDQTGPAWSAALDYCQNTTIWREGKWNFDARVYVGEGYLAP